MITFGNVVGSSLKRLSWSILWKRF